MKQHYRGEGDYQASRRFNSRQTGFVKTGGYSTRAAWLTTPALVAAEQSGKSHAMRGDHDTSDQDGSVSSEAAMPITRSVR